MILSLSGEGGSSARTERWIVQLLNPGPEALFYINYSVRKGAHVVAYAILAILNLRAIHTAPRAVALALLVAIADESHQAGFATRTAALADIGFDFCGASLGAMLFRVRNAE